MVNLIEIKDKHKSSLNEFLWMWIASLSPIIFGSFFVSLKYPDSSYAYIIFNSVEVDTVFAYVATMIAPFLFILSKFVTEKNEAKRKLKNIKFGGWLIALSFIIIVITSGVFYQYKVEAHEYRQSTEVCLKSAITDTNNSTIKCNSIINASIIKSNITFSDLINVVIKDGMKRKVLLICYIISIVIWYYTIYLNNLVPPNIQENENRRVNAFMGDISEITRGQNNE